MPVGCSCLVRNHQENVCVCVPRQCSSKYEMMGDLTAEENCWPHGLLVGFSGSTWLTAIRNRTLEQVGILSNPAGLFLYLEVLMSANFLPSSLITIQYLFT